MNRHFDLSHLIVVLAVSLGLFGVSPTCLMKNCKYMLLWLSFNSSFIVALLS